MSSAGSGPSGPSGPMHDENYKRIFAFPRVIEDLLRAFVGQILSQVGVVGRPPGQRRVGGRPRAGA